MANPFSLVAAQLEATIDHEFGEDIRLLPYKVGEYMTDKVPDTSRSIVLAVGFTVMRKSDPAPIVSGGHNTRGDAPLLLSVQDKYLGSTVAGDRVAFLDPKRNGLICEISYIEPSTNHRPTLHLLRNKVTP